MCSKGMYTQPDRAALRKVRTLWHALAQVWEVLPVEG